LSGRKTGAQTKPHLIFEPVNVLATAIPHRVFLIAGGALIFVPWNALVVCGGALLLVGVLLSARRRLSELA
jgi:hypothetical protein